MLPLEIMWLVMILALLLYIVWRWMKVNDHVNITLGSDVVTVDIKGVVTFSGTVLDLADIPQVVDGSIEGVAPDGATISLPFTTDATGAYSVVWDASLPAGTWSFVANVAGVVSAPLAIT